MKGINQRPVAKSERSAYQDIEAVEFVAVPGDGHVLDVAEDGQRDDGVDALPQQPVLNARLVEIVPQLRQRPLTACGAAGRQSVNQSTGLLVYWSNKLLSVLVYLALVCLVYP